jgi:four helix bundle protein
VRQWNSGTVKQKEETMSQLPRVASFQDLVVYRKAHEFSREIFLLTRSFPKEETYSLID